LKINTNSQIFLLPLLNGLVWFLMPLSTMFHIHRGIQFYWWRKSDYPEKTTVLSQVTDLHFGIHSIVTLKQIIWNLHTRSETTQGRLDSILDFWTWHCYVKYLCKCI
jgi:hypothetical protein